MKKELVAGLLLALGTGGISLATEAVPQYQMNEVIVTATATPVDSQMKTNAAVNVITREEIQEKHYQNLQDILDTIPGYGGFSAANGIGFEVSNYTRPYMRGSDKTVVLIDGVKQDFGGRFYSANAIRNVNDIERIEVLRGTASTLYGAEAVGGVINIITRSYYDKPTTKLSVTAGNFSTKSGQLDLTGENGKEFWSVSYLRRNQGDYKDGHGRTRPQDANLNEGDIKFGIHLNETNDLIFKFVNHFQDQDYVEGRTLGYDNPGHGVFRYNTQTLIWNSRDKNGSWANSFALYRGTMFNDRRLWKEKDNPKSSNWTEKSKQGTWSITNRYWRQLNDQHRLSAGFEYYDSYQNMIPTPYASATAWGKVTLKETSAYIQDEWNITKNLKFTAGVRYADPDIAKSRILPSFDLGYSWNDNALVYVSSKGYMNYPSYYYMQHATRFNGSTGKTQVYDPASDLKPQTGTTNEIGAKFKIGNNTYFDIAYYDRRQRDSFTQEFLRTEGDTSYYLYKNISDPMHIKGVEANLRQYFGDHVTVTLGYSHLTAPLERLIANMARNSYSIDAVYRQKNFNIGITGIGKSDIARSTALINAGVDIPIPGFWVWNLYSNYQMTPNTKLWVRVNNLFDRFYMFTPEWSTKDNEPRYYSKPGRSFVIGVDYEF